MRGALNDRCAPPPSPGQHRPQRHDARQDDHTKPERCACGRAIDLSHARHHKGNGEYEAETEINSGGDKKGVDEEAHGSNAHE